MSGSLRGGLALALFALGLPFAARLRFDEGYTSYLEVVDTKRSLFNAQLSSAQTQGAIFQSLVNIYKAMGGGWVVAAEQIAAEPPQAAK